MSRPTESPYFQIARQKLILIWLLLAIGMNVAIGELTGNRVDFPHFSFLEPDRGTWSVEAQNPGSIQYGAKFKKTSYLMTLQEVTVPTDLEIEPSAEAIADDLREQEKQIMMRMGVQSGMYKLHNLKKGREQIAGKTFYTMKYRTETKSGFRTVNTWSELYLYFHKQDRVTEFFWALYTESAPSEKKREATKKQVFVDLLASIEGNSQS